MFCIFCDVYIYVFEEAFSGKQNKNQPISLFDLSISLKKSVNFIDFKHFKLISESVDLDIIGVVSLNFY